MQYAATFQNAVDALEHLRGDEALSQIQRIIDLAKTHDDVDALIEWQQELIETASHYDRFDLMISAFQRLSELYEAEPDEEDLRDMVLWYWKWMLEKLPRYLEVPLEQIATMQEKMEEFYRSEEEPISTVHALRYTTEAFMGRTDEASHWLAEWDACPQGDLDDCPACQTNMRVQALLDLDRMDEAIEIADPLIEGEESCDEVPAVTFSRLLLPLLFRDFYDLCFSMMSHIRQQVRHTPRMFCYFADHLLLLSLVPSPQTARRHAAISIVRLATCRNDYARFCNSRAAWVWARRRTEAGMELSLPQRTLAALPCANNDGDVIDWLEADMRRLARAFDDRHGTDRFQRLIEAAEDLITVDLDF